MKSGKSREQLYTRLACRKEEQDVKARVGINILSTPDLAVAVSGRNTTIQHLLSLSTLREKEGKRMGLPIIHLVTDRCKELSFSSIRGLEEARSTAATLTLLRHTTQLKTGKSVMCRKEGCSRFP